MINARNETELALQMGGQTINTGGRLQQAPAAGMNAEAYTAALSFRNPRRLIETDAAFLASSDMALSLSRTSDTMDAKGP